MRAWTNTIVSLTLICYMAVASVASAHAFPQSLSTIDTSQASIGISLVDMSPSCHQQAMDDTQSKTTSICKIFCAAMSNIIIDDVAVYLLPNAVSAEIAFLLKDAAKLSLSMEPHPPK